VESGSQPRGSSSGSAAAGAARMVTFALGTQTVGSTIKPAGYCGIVGFKPTYGRISCAGVGPVAWSFDTVDIFCRHVEDVALGFSILNGFDPADLASVVAGGHPAEVVEQPVVDSGHRPIGRVLQWREARLDYAPMRQSDGPSYNPPMPKRARPPRDAAELATN